MMETVLEPEVMDSLTEVTEYDAMDFTEVNTVFEFKRDRAASPVGEGESLLDLQNKI